VGDKGAKALWHAPVPQTPTTIRRTSGTEWKHGVWVG